MYIYNKAIRKKEDKPMYTVKDARREVSEMIKEGEGFDCIRIFLNDLARGKDITWEEAFQIKVELIDMIDCSFGTYYGGFSK